MQSFDSKNIKGELKNSFILQKQNSLIPNINISYNFYLAGLIIISLPTF